MTRQPLLALVHGMEDGPESWRPLARRLPAHWQVVPLRLPWSAGNDYRWRRRGTAAEWVLAELAGLDRSPSLLIGHSFGASALLEVLARGACPGVRGAVLAAPFYRPPGRPAGWPAFERAREHFAQIITDGVRTRLGGRFPHVDVEVRESMVGKMVERIGPAGFLTLFEEFSATGDLDLAGVDVPTLVVGGSADPCLAGGRAESLRREMPAATVRLRAGFDHFCHVAQAEEVAAEIRDFGTSLGLPGTVRVAAPPGRPPIVPEEERV
jgi:pimeloyl-ACP methyl ester carboxylesterase